MPSPQRTGRPAGGPLTTLFSSTALPEIVALLDRLGTLSIEELAGHAAVSRVTIRKEVTKLTKLGIVTVRADGTRRHVTLTDAPVTLAVRALAALACDVPHIVSSELGAVPGAEKVVIFGSWAARKAGEHGRLPNDIDVLVIGPTDADDVYEAAERATVRVGIPVNAKRVSVKAWETREDPFLAALADRPMLDVTS